MANIPPIQFRRSSISAAKPLASQLQEGELALNFADNAIYTKDHLGNIISLGGSGKGAVYAFDSEQYLYDLADADSDTYKVKESLFLIKSSKRIYHWDSDTDTFVNYGGGGGGSITVVDNYDAMMALAPFEVGDLFYVKKYNLILTYSGPDLLGGYGFLPDTVFKTWDIAVDLNTHFNTSFYTGQRAYLIDSEFNTLSEWERQDKPPIVGWVKLPDPQYDTVTVAAPYAMYVEVASISGGTIASQDGDTTIQTLEVGLDPTEEFIDDLEIGLI